MSSVCTAISPRHYVNKPQLQPLVSSHEPTNNFLLLSYHLVRLNHDFLSPSLSHGGDSTARTETGVAAAAQWPREHEGLTGSGGAMWMAPWSALGIENGSGVWCGGFRVACGRRRHWGFTRPRSGELAASATAAISANAGGRRAVGLFKLDASRTGLRDGLTGHASWR
jgi:hypothetical protein